MELYKNDYGFDILLEVETNQTDLTLENADEVTFKAVGMNTGNEVQGTASYDDGYFKYTIKEDDFTVIEPYRVFLVFDYKSEGDVLTRATGNFGILRVV